MEPLKTERNLISRVSARECGVKLYAWLSERQNTLRLLTSACFLSLLGNLILALCCAKLLWRKQAFIVIDPSPSVHLGNAVSFRDAKTLHVEASLQAISVLLSRNPSGLDMPEFISSLFTRECEASVQELLKQEAKLFKEKALRQKPEVSKIDIVRTESSAVEVEATGQLIRLSATSDTEAFPFKLKLVFRRTPDLLKAARFPLLVSQFSLKYHPE